MPSLRSWFIAALVSICVSAGTGIAAAQGAPSHAVNGQSVFVGMGAVDSVRIDPRFRHLGARRFILGGVADTELHVFADADSTGAVRAFFWLQLESRIPSAPGRYEYPAATLRDLQGIQVYAHARRYEGAPAPDGDRAHAWAILVQAGLRPPPEAMRARFVYLPDSTARSELMLIYVEPSGATGPLGADEEGALFSRAGRGFRFVMRGR